MRAFNLSILTPDKKIYEGKTTSLILPTKEGQINILYNHTPIIALISIGEIIVEIENKQRKIFYLQGGLVEVMQNGDVQILADREIDIENLKNFYINEQNDLDKHIKEAKKRAEEAMKRSDDIFTEIETGHLEKLLHVKKRGRN